MTPHGNRNTYGYWRCRCDLCTTANRDNGRAMRAALITAEPHEDAHGKQSTYCNWGCRCEPCSQANKDKCRERRKATS